LRGLTFASCYFQSTSLENAQLREVRFTRCQFDGLELGRNTQVRACAIDHCEVAAISPPEGDVRFFDPESIHRSLSEAGFEFVEQTAEREARPLAEPDEETEVTQRAIRLFLRANHINQDVFKLRLGTKTNVFMDEVLPQLLRVGVVEETRYAGSGKGRRFRLAKPMQQIDAAMRSARGSFESFLAAFE
jgi:hypothetical protein